MLRSCALVVVVVAAAGCGDSFFKASSFAADEDLQAFGRVETRSREDGAPTAQVFVSFSIDGDFGVVFLTGGDDVTAAADGTAIEFVDDDEGAAMGGRGAVIDADTSEVTMELRRFGGVLQETTVSVVPPFANVQPAPGSSFSRAEGVRISWEHAGRNGVGVHLEGECALAAVSALDFFRPDGKPPTGTTFRSEDIVHEDGSPDECDVMVTLRKGASDEPDTEPVDPNDHFATDADVEHTFTLRSVP